MDNKGVSLRHTLVKEKELRNMNNIAVFNFEENQVRAKTEEGETWFVLKDLCTILGVGNPSDVAARLDDDEKGIDKIETLGGEQEMVVVNEAGLYNVILRSNKPEAKKFRRWVTHEVLPSIRRQGYYSALPPEQLAEIVLEAVNDKWKLEHVIIPALRDADINQCMLVAQYMGLTAEEFNNNPKLIKKSNKNLGAKNVLKSWERHGWEKYTIDDLPEEYRDRPQTMLAIEKASKKYGCYGWFAEYCGKMYFNKSGYKAVIEQMKKMGYIADSQAFKRRCYNAPHTKRSIGKSPRKTKKE